MASKLKFIIAICLSAGLGLCWYPLEKIESMRIESSQLLFFAFSTASVLTVPFMARQVEKWRKKTFGLLVFGLTGGVANVLLHYSLLHGNPIVAVAIFCIAIITSFFLDRLARGLNLAVSEFLVVLSLIMVTTVTLLAISDLLTLHPHQFLAVLAGIGFYKLSLFSGSSKKDIPIMSRVAASFLASTWLVGMVLIFSPHSTSFPQENSALFSALYGAMILMPMIASLVCILTEYKSSNLLLWVTLLLSVNFFGLIFYFDIRSAITLAAPLLLLVLAYFILIAQWKKISSNSVIQENNRF